MIDPLNALLIAFAILIICALLFWPKKGLISRWQRAFLDTKRILLEDALKHLYDCEYKNTRCTLNSIAGSLNISSDRTTRLLSRLEAMDLIQLGEKYHSLTDTGRSYALRIIRVHRIWERYLADETGIHELDWHNEADEKEHKMSLEAANQLAAQIGNPVFDPHGDPIPSSKGEIPANSGIALNQLKKGQVAKITHLEDEPNTIYAQLVAEGLYPGMQVRMGNISKEKITFIADGEEKVLAPLFAANITVAPFEAKQTVRKDFQTLSQLKIGEKAHVIGISAACRGQQRRRLMDFGIVPGTEISIEMKSPGSNPIAYRIMDTTIALRNVHADLIYIKKLKAS